MDYFIDHDKMPHKRSIDSLNFDETYKDLINDFDQDHEE